MGWRSAAFDVGDWLAAYARRRYGPAAADAAVAATTHAAWQLLRYSVYACNRTQMGTSGSLLASRPALVMKYNGCCADLTLAYDPTTVLAAWARLRAAVPALGAQPLFRYDLCTVALQARGTGSVRHALTPRRR
jgi:hypothetical protein